MTGGRVDEDRIATSVERPSAAVTASIVEAAMEDGRVVSLVGQCRVDVPGRDGQEVAVRLVLVKPDGSVVVHGRDGASHEVGISGDGGVDVSSRDGAVEMALTERGDTRRLLFTDVASLTAATVDPGDDGRGGRGRSGSTAADPHESIRERLLDDPDLVEPGFRPLSTERETPAGPVDLYGRDAEGRAVVVEVKSRRAGPAAVGQLDRYVAALGRDLHADAEVRGVLVAPSATERTRRLLDERGFTFRALSMEG